jgi:hypothetical protein
MILWGLALNKHMSNFCSVNTCNFLLSFVHHHGAAVNTMHKGLQEIKIAVNATRAGKHNSNDVGNQQNM